MNAQVKVTNLDPANRGLITCLIMHLIRSIITTPQKIPAHVTKAINDIGLEGTRERFGLPFLHDLDLKTAYLPGIDQRDSKEVLQSMQAKHGQKEVSNDETVSAEVVLDGANEYPFGSSPSWNEVQNALKTSRTAGLFIRPWQWKECWAHNDLADKLFINFTRDFWSSLNKQLVKQDVNEALTLQEAMSMWSLDSFIQTLIPDTYQFMANNAGLSGVMAGNRHTSFIDRRRQFFLHTGTASPWDAFDRGYLKQYRIILRDRDNQEVDKLHKRLDELFDNIQCLPDSNARVLWRQQDGLIVIQTNPKYYRLKTIVANKKAAPTIRATAPRGEIIAQVEKNHHGVDAAMAKQALKTQKRNQKRRGASRQQKQVESKIIKSTHKETGHDGSHCSDDD